MAGNTALRAKVLEAIQGGKLPDRAPDRTRGGNGCGAPCAICGDAVSAHEIELELDYASCDDSARCDTYRVHLRCFSSWVSERQELGRDATATAPGPLHASAVDIKLRARERETDRNGEPS